MKVLGQQQGHFAPTWWGMALSSNFVIQTSRDLVNFGMHITYTVRGMSKLQVALT